MVGFILIAVFYKKKKFHGHVFLFYAIWYGAGRAFIEGFRTDSLYLGPIRISQLVSAVICAAGIILMVIGCMRAPRAPSSRCCKGCGKGLRIPQREKFPKVPPTKTLRSPKKFRRDTKDAAEGTEDTEESAKKDNAESKEEDNG